MYDQYDDKNQKQLHAFNKVIDLPAFVKTAAVTTDEDINEIPSNCFADIVNRKYPTHTKKDAYMSRLYFAKNSSMYKESTLRERVKTNLEKAASFWGLDDSYEVKPAEEKMAFTLPIHDYQGNEVDKWVLQSPRDFEKAAIQIFENKNMFTYPQRHTLARNMLKTPLAKQAELAPEVSEYLEKAAGYGMCTKEQALSCIEERAALYERDNPEFSEKLVKVAELVVDNEIKPKVLHKVARVIDVCDQELSYTRFYDKGLTSPEEALYQYTEKTAKEIKASMVSLQNGEAVNREKLSAEVLDDFFNEYMGEIPQGDLNEKIAVVRTLPAPDADALINYLGK